MSCNAQRNTRRQPGSDPELTFALLTGIHVPDVDALERTASLLNV